MSRPPIPLNALRAFEAVARHGSVKSAADELAVTPPAVSHHLRLLEDYLGRRLLVRKGRRLTITDDGARLLPELTDGLDRIYNAVLALRDDAERGPLRLSVEPSFAAHWLMPRLRDYPFEAPDHQLMVSPSSQVVDFDLDNMDAAIRHGRGQWPGLHCERLVAETMGLYVKAVPNARDVRECAEGARLFTSPMRESLWHAWNASRPGGPLKPASVVRLDSTGLVIRAVSEGMGLGSIPDCLAEAAVIAGEIVKADAHTLSLDTAYFLVCPMAFASDRRFRNLRRWLFERAVSTDAPAALELAGEA